MQPKHPDSKVMEDVRLYHRCLHQSRSSIMSYVVLRFYLNIKDPDRSTPFLIRSLSDITKSIQARGENPLVLLSRCTNSLAGGVLAEQCLKSYSMNSDVLRLNQTLDPCCMSPPTLRALRDARGVVL